MATIIFNGKTYNTPDEMSAADRAAFEQLAGLFVDKNGNGIPDFLEGDIVKNVTTAYTNIVNINGKMVTDMNELPEDVRAKVKTAFEKMAEMGIVTNESSPNMAQISSIQVGQAPQFTSSPSPIKQQEYPSTIQEGGGPGMVQWILLGLLLFFCIAAVGFGAFYFLR
jgi:hypothetical protein